MKKSNQYIFTIFITLFFLNSVLFCHVEDHHEKSESSYDPFIKLILEQVAFMEGRLTSLAEAMPAD